MIKTFADRRTKELFDKGRHKTVPPDITRRAVVKLHYLEYAATMEDLRQPPGNRLHELKGEKAGTHAIRVNDQWRICFIYKDGAFHEVELADYH